MATETMTFPVGLNPTRLSVDDFETASIRSAAPSYISEAPSYHTLPPNDYAPPYAAPAYTPRATNNTSTPTSTSTTGPARTSTPTQRPTSMLPPSSSSFAPGAGLPPIPRRSDLSSAPSLSQFHIPSWSSIGTGNPQARLYQSVASRRAAAASASSAMGSPAAVEGALRAVLNNSNNNRSAANLLAELNSSVEEDENVIDYNGRAGSGNGNGLGSASGAGADNGRVRPLEDPDLVGEEAAAQARDRRMARKHGDDILILEDRRWDWWLAQMRDLEERERGWNAFRNNMERGNRRTRFARRFGR